MITDFNIDEVVAVKGTVERIEIGKEQTVYKVSFDTGFEKISHWCTKEGLLKVYNRNGDKLEVEYAEEEKEEVGEDTRQED